MITLLFFLFFFGPHYTNDDEKRVERVYFILCYYHVANWVLLYIGGVVGSVKQNGNPLFFFPLFQTRALHCPPPPPLSHRGCIFLHRIKMVKALVAGRVRVILEESLAGDGWKEG